MVNNKHNIHLDGLRGVAILMIIAYHYFTGFYIFDFGWSGVDLFFILSGYLLSGRILPYLSDKKIIWKFYFNRILRIVPLYFSFLMIFYLVFYLVASTETQNLYNHQQNPFSFFFFTSNWMFILNYSSVQNNLSHLWSLSVEEQFYLIFPLYIFIIEKKILLLKSTIILIVIVLILRCISYNFIDKIEFIKNTWNTFYRMDCFFLGLLIYLLKENGFLEKNDKWIGLVLTICVLSILIGGIYEHTFRINHFFVTIGFTIVAVAYGCIIILVINERKNFLKKITSNATLIFFGKISFGLYIFHWPIYLTMFSFINFFMRKTGIYLNAINIQLVNIIISSFIATVISYLSFKYYESIFLKWKFKPQIT